MTVQDLINQLEGMDSPDSIVVVSSDAEGNSFSPLDLIGSHQYVAETLVSGYLDDEESVEDGEESETVPSVVLWPTY